MVIQSRASVAATNFFGQSLQAPPPQSDLPEDEEVQKRREELREALDGVFEKDYPDYDGSE